MTKQRFCFLQVSDNLLNPYDKDNPADCYYKTIWPNMAGEGYYRPEHYWEIPAWIAELSYCLDDQLHEKQLFHVDVISRDRHYPILPEADIYLGSIMDCNKEHFRVIARNNPKKFFYFGGYIGREEFYSFFCYPGLTTPLGNVSWCDNMQEFCDAFQITYQYGTDYSLFKGTKCIPRLTLSKGCTNHCRFCTIPNKIIEINWRSIHQQIESMRDLDFELIYINDKTFGQCNNYKQLKYMYRSIAAWNPKFRGFTVQTTYRQILKFFGEGINLKDLGIVNVELGIESYNDSILKKYNKPQNIRTINIAMEALKFMDINIIPNIIIGLPGETIHTYFRTWQWIKDNEHKFLMLNVTNFVPYEGTEAAVGMIKNKGDENQTTRKRSWHTAKETKATKLFSDSIFSVGMEIIKATKAKSR